MTGRKRTAEEPQQSTRAAKAAKADPAATPAKVGRGGRKSSKTAPLAVSVFKNRALPLHANITHTPPAIESDESTAVDVGAIGNVTLTPTSFSTGSYGWKGSKRIIVELQGAENQEEKEKVHVLLTINATVVGSKGAKDSDQTHGETLGDQPTDEAAGGGEQKPEEAEESGEQNQAEGDNKPNGE